MRVNSLPYPTKSEVSFVLLDNSHLTAHGVRYFCALSKTFVLVTSNASHPAFGIECENLKIILQSETDLPGMLKTLKKDYGCDRLTVQSGGTVNKLFLEQKLFDYIDLVVAPVLIGGAKTASLIDGQSLTEQSQLPLLCALELTDCVKLSDSYVRLRYKAIK